MKLKSLVLAALTFFMLFGSLPPIAYSHEPLLILQGGIRGGSFPVLVEGQSDLNSKEIALLQNYGTVTTAAGPIAVIHTTSQALLSIARLNFITEVEKSYPMNVEVDTNVLDVGALQVWDSVRDPLGRNVTGAGVIVGFVDTGIDTTNPDFTFPNGTTKILYIWDQTISGRSPTGFQYGYECNSADIEARTCPEVDTFGHGTHVAGIAASSGLAKGNYTGVAPGASIIFVKSGNEVCYGESWTFNTAQILDGINYMVQKAAKLGMRLVVNLSLGGNIGAHDGTDPFERALDAFVREGTPIVVAAGNAAHDQDHIDGRIGQGQNITFQLAFTETTTDVAVDVWYSTRDEITATLHAPDGTSYPVGPFQRGVTTGFGEVNTTKASFPNGNELYVEVNSTASLPKTGWSISLLGNQIQSDGTWDAWTDSSTCTFPGSTFLPGTGYQIDPNDTVSIPATATDVVTVGAYVARTFWDGMDGKVYGQAELTPGEIASFSSLGLTRDGRVKPDVVAPGELIISDRSSAVPESSNDPDPYHRVLAGTSMATPHVVGVIALMLQYDPEQSALNILQTLRESARSDGFTELISKGSGIWGFGKVDARTATGMFRDTVVINGIPSIVNATLQLNHNETVKVQGGSWTDYYYEKGTAFTIAPSSQVQSSEDTRYQLKGQESTGSPNPVISLNYQTQFLLTVSAPFGPVTGTGWYDEGSNATASAPTAVRAPGLEGYLGGQYILTYWIADNGATASNTVVMDSPVSLTAIYTLEVPPQTIFIALIAAIFIDLAAILLARKRLS